MQQSATTTAPVAPAGTKTVPRPVTLMGDEAVAEAVMQCDVDVISAYPITPQTIIVEKLDEYYAEGKFKGEFVSVESEHSAMSVCLGASATGVRVFTATSSQGLAYMHEMLYNVSGMRLPIVMAVANRALSAPLVLNADHGDMMGSRDSGWIQVYAENVQEIYDRTIQLFRVSEDLRVKLPSTLNFEGFILSHNKERLNLLEDDAVKKFVRRPTFLHTLDPSKPTTFGAIASPDNYFEFKMQQTEAMKNALRVFGEVEDEYAAISGRKHGLVNAYGTEEAERIVVVNGCSTGTVRYAAKQVNRDPNSSEKVGVIGVKLYRPFPSEEILRHLASPKLKSVVVLDRSVSFGAPAGPLAEDVTTAMSRAGMNTPVLSVMYGLGGRDFSVEHAQKIFALAQKFPHDAGPVMFGE